MAAPLSQRAYSRHRAERGLVGTTHRAVQKAIEDGRIAAALVHDASGKVLGIDPAIADRLWSEQTTGSANASTEQLSRAAAKSHAARGNTLSAKGRAALAADAAGAPSGQSEDPPLTGGSATSYAQARAIKEAYEARLKKLEYDEKSGKLIPADKVKADCFKAAVVVKEALLNLPIRIAPELASLTDPFEVERVLRQEIHAVLDLCSREFGRAGGVLRK